MPGSHGSCVCVFFGGEALGVGEEEKEMTYSVLMYEIMKIQNVQ